MSGDVVFWGRRVGRSRTIKEVLKGVFGVGETGYRWICREAGVVGGRQRGRRSLKVKKRLEAARSRRSAQTPRGVEGERHCSRLEHTRRHDGSVRGWRRRNGLPARGQRTQSNAQTARRLNRGRGRLA